MRPIDADALRDKLQREIDKVNPPFDDVLGSIRCGVRLARNMLEDEPTIDAVKVVRCKDCKYYKSWEDTTTFCCFYHIAASYVRYSDDYCSRGEMREDGTD